MYHNCKLLSLCFFTLAVVATTCRAGTLPPHLWSQRFGDAGDQQAWCVTVDDSGNVITGGLFGSTVDFGGGVLECVGQPDIYVAKFTPDGDHIWSRDYGDALFQRVFSVAVDKLGNVLIAGQFYGTVNFGGGVLTSAGDSDVFVAKLDPSGNHLWSLRFGGRTLDHARSVDTDAWGNVILTGSFSSTSIDFGGGPLTGAGSEDVFLAKFSSSGNHIWSRSFGDASYQSYPYIAVDDSGNIVFTGKFSGTIDLGGGPLESEGENDIFLAKFDPNGGHMWSQCFGDPGEQESQFIAVDGLANVYITGYFYSSVDFGGGVLASTGGADIFLAKFNPAGDHMWSKRFGDSASQYNNGIAVDLFKNPVITGYFNGTVDFGGGPLVSAGNLDIYMAQFDADGNHLWSQRYGAWEPESSHGVAVDHSGNFVTTGKFQSTVDFGGGPLTCAGANDIYLVKYGSTAVGIHDPEPVHALEIRAFPNPFNPSVTISFTLPRRMRASLGVYDVQGRLLEKLIDETLSPGPHEFEWNGRDSSGNIVGSGVYFCRLQTQGRVLTEKTVLLK